MMTEAPAAILWSVTEQVETVAFAFFPNPLANILTTHSFHKVS